MAKKQETNIKPIQNKPKTERSITSSSTAEYFSKNLQQVGFSSPTKAVLTIVKEAVDNSLDACEDHHILPNIEITLNKLGPGSTKNSDRIQIIVEDNGPGIAEENIARVFGEYLASSKFGRGRCSRGQQGIGISAATTWALQTTATPVQIITKTEGKYKAIATSVEVDLKNNKGLLRNTRNIDWPKPHGTRVEFIVEGHLQLNGEAGLLNYLRGNVLVNPHMTLTYHLPDMETAVYERVTTVVPVIPEPTEPHPHTMKLGEFIAHARLFGSTKLLAWFRTGFSRMSDKIIEDMWKTQKLEPTLLTKNLESINEDTLKKIFAALHETTLAPPSTQSVVSIGEEALSLSVERLGEIDFFAVATRRPSICDFKPVQVEIAIARVKGGSSESDDPVQILRFANRVPLQFDKASCAIVKAITTVNWRSYGLKQPRNAIPTGSYIIAVSVVSPFIKFKNASKETIDASDELVEEIRKGLMQAGQNLARHLSREKKASDLEEKIQHLEKFGPTLVETLCRITKSNDSRKKVAYSGLQKILGRDTVDAHIKLQSAESALDVVLTAKRKRLNAFRDEDHQMNENNRRQEINENPIVIPTQFQTKIIAPQSSQPPSRSLTAGPKKPTQTLKKEKLNSPKLFDDGLTKQSVHKKQKKSRNKIKTPKTKTQKKIKSSQKKSLVQNKKKNPVPKKISTQKKNKSKKTRKKK